MSEKIKSLGVIREDSNGLMREKIELFLANRNGKKVLLIELINRTVIWFPFRITWHYLEKSELEFLKRTFAHLDLDQFS